jgi:hypothetical protein
VGVTNIKNANLLQLSELLDRAIHALLDNSDFLVFLITKTLDFAVFVVNLAQEIVDLNLLGLRGAYVSQRLKNVQKSKAYPKRVFEFGELPVVLRQHTRHFRALRPA